MAGIYIHIPFCKQACNYCNFHFTTSLQYKNELIAALLKEMELQQNYFGQESVETIYFGGGTPSLLQIEDLKFLIERIRNLFDTDQNAEVTFEVNPEDITRANLICWKETGINRLSIGIQSFFEEDLQWMNRSHSAEQAFGGLQLAKSNFTNISIDLIYGTPLLSNEKWKYNIGTAIGFNIPHLSCYALTVEPRTALHRMITLEKIQDIDPDKQSEQFLLLMQWLEEAGYEHYEISNFAKPHYRSRHNSSYWQGKKYLGIGPSAHSFDGNIRQWNISNNSVYIESIIKGTIPFEKETLTPVQKINEYIMTSLRTSEGLNLGKMENIESGRLMADAKKYLDHGLMRQENNFLLLTKEGKLVADGIAAGLFAV